MKTLCIVLTIGFALSVAHGSAQCLRGNCRNGVGKYLYPSGALYEGEFVNGKIHGRGRLIFSNGNIYEGDWKQHYREGKGKLISKSGDVYTGDFKHNQFSGKGIMRYADGDRYEGDWRQSKPNGMGIYSFANGEMYRGSFKDGAFEGFGTYHYTDGAVYEGEWSKGLRHGEGKLTKADGASYAGIWRCDELEGGDGSDEQGDALVQCFSEKRRYSYADGSVYEGEFRQGVPDGEGTCYYANGDKYVGGWKDHAPHGEGVMYFANGKVHGAYWSEGEPVVELELRQKLKLKKNIRIDRDPQVKIWALIVGVSRYKHMPALRYTDDDAYRMYAFFKSPEGGALPDRQIKVLIDEEATRENILSSMQELFLQADENDVVIMYFSGHGLKGSFIPIDYNGYENKLRHDEIKYILGRSVAKHKVCLADACYSGSFVRSKSAGGSLQHLYDRYNESAASTVFLMSSSSGEVSLEASGIRQGIFSHYLLKGLSGKADFDGDRIIELSELYRYVHKGVTDYTDNEQTPVLFGKVTGQLPLAFVRK